MPTNDFLPFGLAIGSNVLAQPAYAALAQRAGGFSSGVAQSLQCNKVWRQSAFIASMVAQFTADRAGVDMLDNGDIAGAEASFVAAISAVASGLVGSGNFATVPALNAEVSARGNAIGAEGATRAAQDSAEAAARIAADTNEAKARNDSDVNYNAARVSSEAAIIETFASYAPLAAFSHSLVMPGYQKFPSGFIFQWLTAGAPSGASTFSLPITFPNSGIGLVASFGSNLPPAQAVGADFSGPGSIRLYNGNPSGANGVYVLAWGY